VFFGNTYVESDYVCTREDGTMFRPGYVSERFFKLIRKHGIEVTSGEQPDVNYLVKLSRSVDTFFSSRMGHVWVSCFS